MFLILLSTLFNVLAPPQFEIKMRNQTARRSEPAVLQCQAKGEKVILHLLNLIWFNLFVPNIFI